MATWTGMFRVTQRMSPNGTPNPTAAGLYSMRVTAVPLHATRSMLKQHVEVLLLCRTWHLWLLWQAVPDRSSWLPAAPDVYFVDRQYGGRQSRRGGSLILRAVDCGLQQCSCGHWKGLEDMAGY